MARTETEKEEIKKQRGVQLISRDAENDEQ
jgi:hypothetical protein